MVILNKKIVKSIFAVLVLFAYTSTINEAHAQELKYLATDGTQTALNENATTVTSSTTNWSNGWYVVSEDVTIADRISVSGTVNLILCNGITLTASKGIGVGSSATFNVYAQSIDESTMGALTATATSETNCAGIGGGNNTQFGTININGGKITATGLSVGAGIGGGYCSNAGNITINGGIVVANAGEYSLSAGIGGGNNGYVNSVTLNGGTISATGCTQYGGAGIGAGAYAGSGTMTITISSGVKRIVATKGAGSDCIGKGDQASTTVNVVFKHNNAEVTGDAKNAVFYDTGEGTERQVRTRALNRSITIDDNIKNSVTASTECALIGETVTLTLGNGVEASSLHIQLNDGTTVAHTIEDNKCTFTMPNGDVTVKGNAVAMYSISLPEHIVFVSATTQADAVGKYTSGTEIKFKVEWPFTAQNVTYGTNLLSATNGIYAVTIGSADVVITATTQRSSNINLSDAPDDFTAINNDVLTGSTNYTVSIADGANITLSNATITGGIVCNGSATITLVGENDVKVTSLANNLIYKTPGIKIGGSGTTLTIKGDGSLTATGGSQAAGIGLGRTWDGNATGGSIVIEGGTVNASGDIGIGIGTVGQRQTASIDGISIKGGTVNASLGKGYIYNGCTATVGYIKIYDTIDMVDASKITESVTYMHVDGNTETDVTASASTYFTIGENGDRRIIVPKDDTDYTITIADDIEHGTLTGAATAKYMEKVTITATPDLGYRLSRLVVKDADNNDVATTGNSFFMPKGDVTVSAVFEQGTHGTTEFVWGYYGPSDFVNEATIYDGVTTVNIQNTEVSYNIQKNEEYTNYKFLLDNNTNNANIPYAGGTGEFYGSGNVTTFRIPDNGQTGYYDITLTDVGNGKWGVSILPTAAQMDVVPDQTYTGSQITPEPLVLAGSLNLTKGTDYEYSYTNNTNVGTATVIATFQGTYASLGYVEKEFTIVPKSVTNNDITVTIPSQVWTGSEMTPVITVKDGETTLAENTDYTVTPPSSTIQNAVNYTYTITGTGNYSGTVEKTFTITPKVTVLGALTLTEDQNGIAATIDGAYTGADAFAIGEDIDVVSVTFNRTFTTSATSTIILPFAITEGNYSGGDFYTLKSVENNIADMTKVTSVTAHTPYLFVPNGETFSITGNVTIEATSATEYATESEDGKWEFKGIYQCKRWGADGGDNKDYCFAANAIDDISVGEFVKIGTYVQVKPFRCYLTRKNDISKSAEQLPETIQIRLIDETASVITPDDPQENTGDITTPVSEIANNNGVKVWSYDGIIYIESAPSTAYTIVDMTGRTLKNGVTNSTRETVTLSRTAGIVIVIINGKTFKVNY